MKDQIIIGIVFSLVTSILVAVIWVRGIDKNYQPDEEDDFLKPLN